MSENKHTQEPSDIHSPFNACMYRCYCKEIEKQRDDLLAACKRLLTAHRITTARPPKTVQQAEQQLDNIRIAVSMAEAAIAAAQSNGQPEKPAETESES